MISSVSIAEFAVKIQSGKIKMLGTDLEKLVEDFALKRITFNHHGAEQVWTVYPKRRVVLVSTEDGPREAREGETVEFHGVVLDVRDLFAFDLPANVCKLLS